MTTTGYDDIQHRFFAESAAYQTVDLQYRIADARYRQSKELARLVRLAGTRVADLFRDRLVAPVVRWYRRRSLFREMMALDDRLLDDIGISRCDIPKLVRDAYGPRDADAATPATGATVHRLATEKKDRDSESADTGRPLAA